MNVVAPLQAVGSRAFALRCDACGRSGPIVLVWRADDESRRHGVLEAVDGAIALGFSVAVSAEDDAVSIMRCICPRCLLRESSS